MHQQLWGPGFLTCKPRRKRRLKGVDFQDLRAFFFVFRERFRKYRHDLSLYFEYNYGGPLYVEYNFGKRQRREGALKSLSRSAVHHRHGGYITETSDANAVVSVAVAHQAAHQAGSHIRNLRKILAGCKYKSNATDSALGRNGSSVLTD